MLRFAFTVTFRSPDLPRDIKSLVPKQTPTWGTEPGKESSAKATWLGYVVIRHDTPVPFGRHPAIDAESRVFIVMLATCLSFLRLLVQHVESVSYSIPYFQIAVPRLRGSDLHVTLVWAWACATFCVVHPTTHIFSRYTLQG
jgi:hypothetical protein